VPGCPQWHRTLAKLILIDQKDLTTMASTDLCDQT
jgi:hypothetical protein